MKINSNLFKNKYYSRVNFLLLIMIFFVCTFFFFYVDQSDTVGHSIFFMESLLNGHPLGAYQDYINLINTNILHGADIPLVYEPFAYFVVGILSLPLVILHKIGYLNFESSWFFLYVKIQQIVLVLGSAYITYLCSKELKMGIERAKYAAFLFLTSFNLIYFAIVIGQMEIYAVFFSLLGTYYWLKNDTLRFIIFFAIAIPLKMFALLIMFPLILIQQKNIFKILLELLLGVSLLLIGKVIWGMDAAYLISTSEPGNRMIEAMTYKQLPGGLGADGIPIFVCLYLLFSIFIFVKVRNQDEKIWGIYCSFVVYALLFLFVGHYPYWIVILTPYLPILIAYKEKYEQTNLLIDSITSIGYMLSSMFYHGWTSSILIVERMFLPLLFGRREMADAKYVMGCDLLDNIGIGKFAPFFVAVYVAGIISLIVINHPKSKFDEINIGIKTDILNRIRILIIVPFLVIMVYCYYSVKPEVLIDTSMNESYDASWDLFSEEVSSYGKGAITQEIIFQEDASLDNIKLYFSRIGNTYAAYASLYIELKDLTNEQILYKKRIGYNQLAWGEFTKFDMNGIDVYADHDYAVLVYPDKWQQAYVHIKVTAQDTLLTKMTFLGHESSNDLYMKIEGQYKK